MPPLQNERQERFCLEIMQGKSATAAYIAAGFSPRGARGSACKLQANASIAARVAELKQRAANGAVMSAQRVLERLTEIATGPRDPISLRALELLGRHHELFGDRRVGGLNINVKTDFDRLPTAQLIAIIEGEGGGRRQTRAERCGGDRLL
jgi:Terminase small subunit